MLLRSQIIFLLAVALRLGTDGLMPFSFVRVDLVALAAIILFVHSEKRFLPWIGLTAGLWHALYMETPGSIMILIMTITGIFAVFARDMAFKEHFSLPLAMAFCIALLDALATGIMPRAAGSPGAIPTLSIIMLYLFTALLAILLPLLPGVSALLDRLCHSSTERGYSFRAGNIL